MLVTLDRAVPAGPWDARIVLRSGLTEREATATVTFPAAAASSAEPVATQTVGSGPDNGSRLLPILAGLVALLAVAFFLFRHRQLRRSSSSASGS